MTYCWNDVHQRHKPKVHAEKCRAVSHKEAIVCDSQCPSRTYEYTDGSKFTNDRAGVRCCETAGRHERCIGPNGPAWEHPADCPCVEVRRVLENPARRAITPRSRKNVKPLDGWTP